MPLAQVNAGDKINASDINQFYSILKGVAASGESVSLIYNAAGAVILQPSSDPATGTELIQIKNNAGTVQMALSSDGKVYVADGAVGSPGLTFEGEKVTGVYRISANTIGVSVNSAEKLRVTATGVSLDAGATYLTAGTDRVHYRYNGDYAPTNVAFIGTGSQSIPGASNFRRFDTGLTNPSTAAMRADFSYGTGTRFRPVNCKRMEFIYNTPTAVTNVNAFIVLGDYGGVAATTSPVMTARHLGVKQILGVTSFTTADGTTEQTTDISAFVTTAASVEMNSVIITFDGTTARCYINGTLRATHATNVPTASGTGALKVYIDNNASANSRQLDLQAIDIEWTA